MGLIGGMARTAVVGGTATTVSRRVSRRQANRWAAQGAGAQPAYQQQPHQPTAPATGGGDLVDQLEKLGDLRLNGLLTDAEFEQQKARLLA